MNNADILSMARELAIYDARNGLEDYIRFTMPNYEFGWFNELLCKEVDQFIKDVEDGKCPMLMVFAPPRSGKSEVCSRRAPPFIFGKHPEWNIIGCSYSSDLANRMSRDVQRIVESPEHAEVFPDAVIKKSGLDNSTVAIRTSDLWEVIDRDGKLAGGAYRAAGVNGGITGQGMNVGIIDDPAKDYQQASSAAYQRAVIDWYDTTFFTRVDPKIHGVIIILTRWHKNDLAGQLLEQAKKGGQQWRVVSFPMVAEKDEVHELNGITYSLRKKGEILFPERMPETFVEKCKLRGDLVWSALYQQRPNIRGGGVLKGEWLQEYTELPLLNYRFMTVDTANKKKETSDYTVAQVWGVAHDKRLFLLDQIRGKWEAHELEKTIPRFWNKHAVAEPKMGKLRYAIVEDAASGTGLIQKIKSKPELSMPIRPINRGKDKATRCMDVQGFIQQGWVYIPAEAPWISDFVMEMEDFTLDDTHAHDDQMDPLFDAVAHVHNGELSAGGSAIDFMLNRNKKKR